MILVYCSELPASKELHDLKVFLDNGQRKIFKYKTKISLAHFGNSTYFTSLHGLDYCTM